MNSEAQHQKLVVLDKEAKRQLAWIATPNICFNADIVEISTPDNSIGGSESRLQNHSHVLIREDRLPHPVVAFHWSTSATFSALDLEEDGHDQNQPQRRTHRR